MVTPDAEARLNYVKVKNGLPFDFTDRHDGVPVRLPPGKEENLPIDMAEHFFGCISGNFDPAYMLRHIAKRQGWNTPDFVKADEATGKNKAQQYFDMLTIRPVMFKMVEVEDADPRTPVPADPVPPGGLAGKPKRGPGRPPKVQQAGAAA